MADVVKLIRKRLLASADLSPAFAIIFTSVQIQGKSQRNCHTVFHIQRVEFGVDIEGEENFLVAFAVGLNARDSVIFCAVDVADFEAALEEDVFRHCVGKMQ